MKLFYTNSSAKEEIGNLETRISALEADAISAAADVSRLTEELKTANESIASLTTERDDAVSAYEAAEASEKKAAAELATANTKLSTFDAEVEAAAQAKFAGLGGPPITASNKETGSPAGSKTMAEFNALSPASRMAFIKSGGKLTE